MLIQVLKKDKPTDNIEGVILRYCSTSYPRERGPRSPYCLRIDCELTFFTQRDTHHFSDLSLIDPANICICSKRHVSNKYGLRCSYCIRLKVAGQCGLDILILGQWVCIQRVFYGSSCLFVFVFRSWRISQYLQLY